MSWQATSWAVEQKTGSPHSKLILLLLANRADEEGICWPSQVNLAAQSEQSDDTVQRHLKNLEGRFIRRARNRRTRGRWPGYVYQLLMPDVAGIPVKELPQKPADKRAARSALNDGPVHTTGPSTEPLSAVCTEPLPAVSPRRSQRFHRAAGSGVESSSKSSHEASSPERSRISTARAVGGRPRALQGKQGRTEVVQDRIARRIGADGWLILQALSPDQLAQITSLERRGHLTDREIDNIRSEAKLAICGALGPYTESTGPPAG